MIRGLAFSGSRYTENSSEDKDDHSPCVICGKLVDMTKKGVSMVHVHEGGNAIVTEEEAVKLNAERGMGGDMDYFPIGRECLRKHPELRAYVT